ncbi:MAG: DUF1501 domain-containing protein [Pyrinomonadaceae bacterium]
MLSSFGKFGVINALAQEAIAQNQPEVANDYKALVCIFLFGGNDANNMIIPYDGYSAYQAVRGSAPYAVPQDKLLQISPRSTGGVKYGFGGYNLNQNTATMTDLQGLFNQGQLAVVTNVGTLVQPITRNDYLSGATRPDSLFSHSDQQLQWQSAITQKSTATSVPTGWGGRAADLSQSLNGTATFPAIISTAGITLFTTGLQARPLVPSSGLRGFPTPPTSDARFNAMRQLLMVDTDSTFVQSNSSLTSSAIDNTNTLNTALTGGTALQTVFPNSSLGTQLKSVANIIRTRDTIGLKRQIFFCSLGGFDTHTNQGGAQPGLLQQVSQAMKAFYDATVEMNVASQVTSFTLSDFGRTFKPSQGGGSDHAWGSHQMVLGGAVRGGDFYGKYPTLALGGPDDVSSEGRWIPTTSVDQYGATLAAWYGIGNADLVKVFPNLGRFSTPNLGFML